MKTLNVKTGDNVVVITGKDAGKKGKVLRTYPSKNRIVVQGVNMVKRHQKARKAQEKSSIIEKEGTIDVSNVMVVCPVCGKPTRVKHTLGEDGRSARVCKCGSALDKKYTKDAKKSKKAASSDKVEVKAEKAKAEKVENTEVKATKKPAAKKVVATATNKEAGKAVTAKKAQRGV